MTKTPLIIIFCVMICEAYGQNQIRGRLKTNDSIRFSIVNVLPDSFPLVSVILKAHTIDGDPIWNLTRENFSVSEDGEDSEVKSLTPVSVNKSINIGMVIDHSGSMLYDNSLLYDKNGNELFSYDTNTFELILPKGYVSPIDNARSSAKEFAGSFNFGKDFISVIGFSSTVDKIVPLTNNKAAIDSVISSMEADSLTALYDAMLAGLNELHDGNALNVLVTLTDGLNNNSKSTWSDVTEKASRMGIPIYIIGLGEVNKDTLQMIADQTKGEFIYTETSGSLGEIYSRISKDIQSFYDLKYESGNLSAIESRRRLTITFLPADTITSDFKLPDEVVVYLKSRAKRMNYIVGTSIVSAISLSVGIVFYRRRRRRR